MNLKTRKPKWDEAMKGGLHKDIEIVERETNFATGITDFFRKYFSIWIVVGVAAIAFYIYSYSWEELQKSFLTWLIGASMVAILTTVFLEWRKRRL